jgi:hypothetical protein
MINGVKFDEFVRAVLEFDSAKLRELQSIFMGVIRDSPYTGRLREGDKELIRDYVRPQTVYFYLQVEEHFNGNYSQKILEANKPNDFDAHLALQAYYTHFILCQNKKAKKQRNLLQEKNRDNIFYPTYFMLLSSMFKTMKS